MSKQKEAYYFSHDSNARNDEKILELRSDYGHEGYGLYFMIIEVLRDATNFKLSKSKINSLSIALNFPAEKLGKFVDDCINKYFLFTLKGDMYYSNRLLRSMKKKEELSNKMRTNVLQRYNKSNTKVIHKRKGKESKVKEKKESSLCLFSNSKYGKDFNLFYTDFTSNDKYIKYDVSYYFEAVKNWSAGKNKMMADWIHTARNFALSDDKENKAKLSTNKPANIISIAE